MIDPKFIIRETRAYATKQRPLPVTIHGPYELYSVAGMTFHRSNCREVTVTTRRVPKTMTGKVRLHTAGPMSRFDCYECDDKIEPGDRYEYRVVRIERRDPKTMRYASHLEYRRKHDSCPEKERK